MENNTEDQTNQGYNITPEDIKNLINMDKSTKKLIHDNYLLIQELSIQNETVMKKCEKNLCKGIKILYFCGGLTLGIILIILLLFIII